MNSREQFLKLNPYVRIVQHIFGNSENYFVPYRIIYDYEMMFVVDGELTILLDDETVTVQKNECVIIPPLLAT
jgi:cupin domain